MNRKSFLKINWKNAVGEIIFIFIGITLAIWFQNWNEDQQDQKKAHKLQLALHRENLSNLAALPETIGQTEDVRTAIVALLRQMGEDYQNKDPELIDSLVFRSILRPGFNASQEVIRDITESGKLSLIKSDSVRYYILQWDLVKSRTETMETIIADQNRQLIIPYLTDHFSMLEMDQKYGTIAKDLPPSAFDIDNRKILGDFKFENLLENQYYPMSYQVQFYNELMAVMQKLDQHLNAVIK